MMSPGFALCLPYIRGIGLDGHTPSHLIGDESVNWVFINQNIGDVKEWRRQLDQQWQRLKIGGTFCIWAPDAKIRRAQMGEWINSKPAWRCLEDDPNAGADGMYLVVLEKRDPTGDVKSDQVYEAWQDPRAKGQKTTAILRMGGYGDGLLGAELAPAYKNGGHYVAYIGSNFSAEAVRHDPHIDLVQEIEIGRMQPEDFGALMTALDRRYDHVVNLGESIEGHIVKLPQRVDYYWPDPVRRKASAINFEEWTACIGGVEFKPGWMRFYPSEEEKAWANMAKSKLCKNGEKLALWAVGGSGEQKIWPYLSAALTQLSQEPDVIWALVGHGERDERIADEAVTHAAHFGGDTSKMALLMHGFKASMRDIMALGQLADLVVGPETGLMNAVAYAPGVSKVIYLSHSSPENIPKHWTDTTVLTPDTSLFPCHRMHYQDNPCPRDHNGHPTCSAALKPKTVVDAVREALRAKRREQLTVTAQAAGEYDIDGDEITETAA